MRIVFVVFCLLLDNLLTQASTSSFNCEELSSNIQTLKDSKITKKEKFSCILNLLKSALTDELENTQCDEEKPREDNKKLIEKKEVPYEIQEKVGQEPVIEEKEVTDKLIAKVTQEKKKNTKNNTQTTDVPTMIPIFKPRPMMERDNFFPSRTRSIPVTENNRNQPNTPRFTIPCQRAADILDMSIAPRTETDKVQPNMRPIIPANPNSADQKPTTLVHCTDLDESVGILFKPKAISLMQVYGNLLKKITITVLVPYHMSKMGQKQLA